MCTYPSMNHLHQPKYYQYTDIHVITSVLTQSGPVFFTSPDHFCIPVHSTNSTVVQKIHNDQLVSPTWTSLDILVTDDIICKYSPNPGN